MVKRKIFSEGIGLLELMLVLAIISMLTVAAVRYFSIVSASIRIEQAMEMVSAIRAAGERWKVGNDNYNSFTGLKDFVDRGFLPSIYSSIKNPWGGTITANKKDGDGSKIEIKFESVHESTTNPECTNFSKRIESLGCKGTPDCQNSKTQATC